MSAAGELLAHHQSRAMSSVHNDADDGCVASA
jgi:hypothetical protein